MRTSDLYSPRPEEANCKLTGHSLMYHFALTKNLCQNLLRERLPDDHIFVTGNTVIDALFWVRDQVLGDTELRASLAQHYPFSGRQ